MKKASLVMAKPVAPPLYPAANQDNLSNAMPVEELNFNTYLNYVESPATKNNKGADNNKENRASPESRK